MTGSWNDPGPIQLWIRLTVPVVADETPTGVQRVAAAADFGNGVSSGIDYERLPVHQPRPHGAPRTRARGRVGRHVDRTACTAPPTESSGAGFAESALHDELGRVGRSVQSLFVEPR